MEHGSVTERQPGPTHSRTPGFPLIGLAVGVSGRVRHKRSTGLGSALLTAVTEPGVRELCVFDKGGQR